MALLQNKSMVIPSVVIDLTFEDHVRKVFTVHVKDIIRVVYNLNGLRTEIQGRVVSIHAASTNYSYHADGTACYHTGYQTNKNGPYMVIDGSGTYDGKTANVYLCDLLDCDMIYAWKENFCVLTVPADSAEKIGSVNALRTVDGVLQYTPDFGETWLDVVVAPAAPSPTSTTPSSGTSS